MFSDFKNRFPDAWELPVGVSPKRCGNSSDYSGSARLTFARFGSEAQVSRALRKLVEGGVIVKLGFGVYAKAKRSALSGRPIPSQPVEVLAEQALSKLGLIERMSEDVDLKVVLDADHAISTILTAWFDRNRRW